MESSGGGEKPRAYLDGGTLAARVLGIIDVRHDGAVRVCDAARRSGLQLITSRLAVMEMIGAVRRKITASRKCRPGRGDDLAAADAHVSKAVADALNLIHSMEQQVGLIIVKMEGESPDFVFLRHKMREHPGYTASGGRSRTCRYRMVGPHDWVLFALARRPARP